MRLVLILILIISSCSFSVVKQEKKDIIVWQENKPLTWDDFRGKPERRFAAASTHYDIIKSLNKVNDVSAEINIEAIFLCKKSWKKTIWVNPSVLAHEQKHFDIVELYARKLRKQLTQIKVHSEEDAEQKLDSLYKIIDAEMDAYQDKYDDETNSSMSHDAQISWIKKIDAAIDSLSAYQNTEVKLKTAF